MTSSRRRLFGLLTAILLTAAWPLPDSGQTGTTAYVNFSFDQVDIRLLAKLVGDMTGKRFIIDNAVNGKVTVVTPPQIPLVEVYPVFLSILESSGFSVVEKGGLYNIVPLPERTIVSAPVIGPGEPSTGQGIITKVIHVENISAIDLRKMIEPMVRGGKSGALSVFGPSNHLIITDTADNIGRIEKIIAELDKPGAAETVEFVRLKHAAAEEIAAELNLAIRGMGTSNQALSQHIQQIAEGGGALPRGVTVVPAISANSLVLVGTPVDMKEVKRIIEMMDVETPSAHGRLNAVFLKYLGAEEAAKSLNALLAKTAEKDQRQRIAIEPSVANNALMVEANPQDFELVSSLIEKLDQVPQQVMVEILIAEVGIGKSLNFGVELSTIESPGKDKTVVAGRTPMGDTDQIMDLVTKGVFPQGLSFGVAKGTTTGPGGTVVPGVFFLVQALAKNRDVKILSNIPLWAQNNTEASVSVVENIPILRSTIQGGSGTARDVIQNIDRVDVGIKLKFTPHVNPEREVTMQLNPSIEAIIDQGPSDTQFAPTIAKREVSTTVTVPDQATIIITGLIREDWVKSVSKVPILGDIPILGWLFRYTSQTKQRTNLLIFVTPHIVTDLKEAKALEKTLRDRASFSGSSTNLNVQTPRGK